MGFEILYIVGPVILVVILIIVIYFLKFSLSKVIEEGKKLMSQDKMPDALRLFKNLINKKPYDPNAHFYLAEAYYKNDDFDWAMTEYKKVESFNRSDYKYFSEKLLHERLADLYLRFGQTTEAQKSLLSILEITPGDYETHLKIGDIFFKRTMFDNALTYYQKALSIRSNGAKALFKCGEVFYYKKDYNQGLGYLKGAIKHDPSLVKACYYIGMIYKSSNNFAKAVAEFERASQNKDVRVNALFQKGIPLIKLGERGQAIQSLDRALKSARDEQNIPEKSPVVMAIRYNLASCYEADKQILQALDHWEKIAEVNADYEDVREKLKLYSDLRLDDRLKDYLTVPRPSFETICKKILEHKGQSILEISSDPSKPYFEAVISESNSEWVKSRSSKKIIQFHRSNDPIGDKIFRTSLEKMKKVSAMGIVVYSSSGFTPAAEEFAKTRPIEPVGRELLSSILNKIEINTINNQ